MAKAKVSTRGTGKSGANSSRWNKRAVVKDAAKKARRSEDYIAGLEAALEAVEDGMDVVILGQLILSAKGG